MSLDLFLLRHFSFTWLLVVSVVYRLCMMIRLINVLQIKEDVLVYFHITDYRLHLEILRVSLQIYTHKTNNF